LKDIMFDFGKATIKAGSAPALDAAAKIIKVAPNETFLIVGQTDKKGSDVANLKLSQQRAASVMNALEARGVNTVQLKSIGIGEQEAVVPETASDAERQADRKVVVRAISGDEWNIYQKSDVKKATPKKK
jgi:outer membrane protein OmpA-like peptidoglycan-associated protein